MTSRELIVLEQAIIDKIKKEGLRLCALFIAIIIIFKIAFYKEDFLTVIRAVLSFFWLYLLPGFAIMYYWSDSLDFIERAIMGAALGMITLGVIGYNLGLFGITMKYHIWAVPFVSILIGALIIKTKKEKAEQA